MSESVNGDPVAIALKPFIDAGFLQAIGIVIHPVSGECAVRFSDLLQTNHVVDLLAQCLKAVIEANGQNLTLYINTKQYQFPPLVQLKF